MGGISRAKANARELEEIQRERPLRVAGVGHGAKTATHNCKLPVCLRSESGICSSGKYEAPTIKDSWLPGLLGLQSLEDMNAVIDFGRRTLHIPGAGNVDLRSLLPAETETYNLAKAPSGHLLLPCTHYEEFDKQQKNGSLRFTETIISLHTTSNTQSSD